MSKNTILVTGSSGFIGFHLSNYLISKKLPRTAIIFGWFGTNTATYDTSLYNLKHINILESLKVEEDFQENLKVLRSAKFFKSKFNRNFI